MKPVPASEWPSRPVVTNNFNVVSMFEIYAQLWPDGVKVSVRDKVYWRNSSRDRLEAGRQMVVAIAEMFGVTPAEGRRTA